MLPRVGVLALQGGFREHGYCLQQQGADVQWVRTPTDLQGLKGLILPGGESTCMRRLLRQDGLDLAIQAWADRGGVLWGTCAGAILLAQTVDGQPGVLQRINMDIQRNAYGRQQESFTAPVLTVHGSCMGVFIRAPRVVAISDKVAVLGRCERSGAMDAVAVADQRVLATTFHPECAFDDWHGMMVRLCQQPSWTWEMIMTRDHS